MLKNSSWLCCHQYDALTALFKYVLKLLFTKAKSSKKLVSRYDRFVEQTNKEDCLSEVGSSQTYKMQKAIKNVKNYFLSFFFKYMHDLHS